AGAAVRIVDMGIKHWPEGLERPSELFSFPIRAGTDNFLERPAMSRAEAYRAFQVGLNLADAWVLAEGFRVVALGEMGIGNTTTACALIAALTGRPAEQIVGR